MKHYILVKYNSNVTEKEEMNNEIVSLFDEAKSISGIYKVNISTNCIQRENRFDIMVLIEMDKKALDIWDKSELHTRWKNDFGKYIDKKAIFDCE